MRRRIFKRQFAIIIMNKIIYWIFQIIIAILLFILINKYLLVSYALFLLIYHMHKEKETELSKSRVFLDSLLIFVVTSIGIFLFISQVFPIIVTIMVASGNPALLNIVMNTFLPFIETDLEPLIIVIILAMILLPLIIFRLGNLIKSLMCRKYLWALGILIIPIVDIIFYFKIYRKSG